MDKKRMKLRNDENFFNQKRVENITDIIVFEVRN